MVDGGGVHTQRLRKGVRTHLSLLGDDLDHASRRVGAVQRGSSRALHNFYGLDVVRVQVVEPVGELSTDTGRGLGLGDTNAIDEDERLIG